MTWRTWSRGGALGWTWRGGAGSRSAGCSGSSTGTRPRRRKALENANAEMVKPAAERRSSRACGPTTGGATEGSPGPPTSHTTAVYPVYWGGNRVRRWFVLTKCRLNITLLFRLYKTSKSRCWYNWPQAFAHTRSSVVKGSRAYRYTAHMTCHNFSAPSLRA